MKGLLATTALFGALVAYSGAASAQVIDDPLHGECVGGCAEATIGGDKVTPLPNGVTGFGFSVSPGKVGTNDLELKFLLPDNFTIDQINAFVAGVTVTGTNQPVGGTHLSLFSTTPWTSGFLETDYLHNTLANGAPKNPLDAFLGATNTLQPTATGYYVALAEVGPFDLNKPDGPLADIFSLFPAVYPAGGLILGNLFTADGVISTAQSGALFFGGPSSGPFCATPPCDTVGVPGPIVGAGIPGLVAACMTMLGFQYRRRRRSMV